MELRLRMEPQLGIRPDPCRLTSSFLVPRHESISSESRRDQFSLSFLSIKHHLLLLQSIPLLPLDITARIHPLAAVLTRRPAILAPQIRQFITKQSYHVKTMAPGGGKRGGGRGGGGGGGRGQSREVQISKALSLVLRHAAEKEGVKIDSQGYANVGELVCLLSKDH